jgi:hypothetical protein
MPRRRNKEPRFGICKTEKSKLIYLEMEGFPTFNAYCVCGNVWVIFATSTNKVPANRPQPGILFNYRRQRCPKCFRMKVMARERVYAPDKR